MKLSRLKLSRRQMIGTALLAAAAPAQSQEPNPDWLTVSADQNKTNAEALEKITLPQATEPAVIFKP
jgi:hypothetical protein